MGITESLYQTILKAEWKVQAKAEQSTDADFRMKTGVLYDNPMLSPIRFLFLGLFRYLLSSHPPVKNVEYLRTARKVTAGYGCYSCDSVVNAFTQASGRRRSAYKVRMRLVHLLFLLLHRRQ